MLFVKTPINVPLFEDLRRLSDKKIPCHHFRADETDDAVASATEDVVMEGRLLDSPCSDVCRDARCLSSSGGRSPPPEDEERDVVGCCAAHSGEAGSALLLEGSTGSDMDTIPEEESASASSELLTESSHLDSDRSDGEEEDSSESPMPRDTPEDGSGELLSFLGPVRFASLGRSMYGPRAVCGQEASYRNASRK